MDFVENSFCFERLLQKEQVDSRVSQSGIVCVGDTSHWERMILLRVRIELVVFFYLYCTKLEIGGSRVL